MGAETLDEARRLAAAGDLKGARSLLALELLRTRRSPRELRRAATVAMDVERRFGDQERALRLARLFRRVGQRLGDRFLVAASSYTEEVLAGGGGLLAAAIRLAAAVELAGEDLPEESDLDMRADLATMLLYLGSARDALRLYEHVLGKATGRTKAKALLGVATAKALEGKHGESAAWCVRALREARGCHAVDMLPEILLGLAIALRDSGRPLLSLRVLRALERNGAERLGAAYWAERARTELVGGSYVRARLSARTAMGFGTSGYALSMAKLVLAELDLNEGRVAEALDGLAQAAKLASGGMSPPEAEYMGRLLRGVVERIKEVTQP